MKFQDWGIPKKSLKKTRIMDRKAIQKPFSREDKGSTNPIKKRFFSFPACAILWSTIVVSTIYNPPIHIPLLSDIYNLDIPGTIMSDSRIRPEVMRALGLYLLGAGVAPLALSLTHSRTQSLRKQTKALEMQTKSDAFSKSIELLGNKRAAVKQGGIYALGKIAKDNPEDHMTVIRIMTSYVRKESYDIFNKHKRKTDPNIVNQDQLIEKLSKSPMPADIEAAIEVIRERNKDFDQEEEEYEDDKRSLAFDISNAYLFNADFNSVQLSRTNFSDSVMSGCVFDNANLSKSLFAYSDLRNASFENCNLAGADLTEAKNLKQEQISRAIIDKDTKLPEGIQHPQDRSPLEQA